MNRAGLVRAISPSRVGVVKSEWDIDELSRKDADSVVKAVLDTIIEALQRGEVVDLPLGRFEVRDHRHAKQRGWILGRIRVLYKKRKYVDFTAAADLEARAGRDK